MVDLLRAEGAEVHVGGADWNAADACARRLIAESADPGSLLYVHPFDDPELWAGHAGLVREIKEQWPHAEAPPDAVVCVVGGGGLLMGVVQGRFVRVRTSAGLRGSSWLRMVVWGGWRVFEDQRGFVCALVLLFLDHYVFCATNQIPPTRLRRTEELRRSGVCGNE